MEISFGPPWGPERATGPVVIGVFANRVLTPSAEKIDLASGGALTRAIKASTFRGEPDQTLVILAPHGLGISRVIAVGLGSKDDLDALRLECFGGAACAALLAARDTSGSIAVDAEFEDAAARVAVGARLRAYRFDRYRSKEKDDHKPLLASIAVHSQTGVDAKRTFAPLGAVAGGVHFTRDLVSEPANVLGPKEFATHCRELAQLGVEVEVLGEQDMEALGMGALLGVGQGSARESQLVVLKWNNGPQDQAPVAFVGKGVCFDSGGISIKPANGMEEMKCDMGGAGVVAGLLKGLAGRGAKVNAVGVLGLVENMPSGSAQRPGDVVTSMSGQTVAVLNTDAEGRLVLADALTYVQKTYKPQAVINLATLTGAVVVALGSEYAGLFSNNDQLCERLVKQGLATGDKVWRLPLGAEYDKRLDSDIADMQNIENYKKEAGSIIAAQFLQRFIENDVPWAHIDIAGVAWLGADHPLAPKGASGFGVRLLDRLVAEHYEA